MNQPPVYLSSTNQPEAITSSAPYCIKNSIKNRIKTRLKRRRLSCHSGACLALLFMSLYASSPPVNATAQGINKAFNITWLNDLKLSVGDDDNVGQSAKNSKIIAEKFNQLNYQLTADIPLKGNQAVSLAGFTQYQRFSAVDDLEQYSLGLSFDFRWQRNLGYLAPFYRFTTSYQYNKFGAKQRNNGQLKTRLLLTKRLSDSLTLVTGIGYQHQSAHSKVFDLRHINALVNIDYSPMSKVIYYAAYGYRKGKIWSTTQANLCNGQRTNNINKVIIAAEIFEPDQAFNSTFCGNWTAYRLKARSHSIRLGINVSLSQQTALDFSTLWIDSDSRHDVSYQRRIMQLTYLLRF
ncbi:MAG: hypothetical protein KUG79_03900 [Pseudomonadales bacterium]|nr:hypothetical protein [Pseudomonadales bacterium]